MATDANINITAASLRGSPSDRIIKPRPRKDSLQSISGSDGHPGRITKPRARKSPGSGAKRNEPAKRKFICSFSHYGCDVALSSKNEWKRHVSIQHLQLGFYRCDVGSCNPDLNPNIPGHKKVYNDFNRKDLFTQHHRRMHKPEGTPANLPSPQQGENGHDWRAFEDSLEDVRARCWHERRKPPQKSTCGFCGRVFEGEGSWNDRMEHVGGHFSRDVIDAKEEREDEDLTAWAVQEAIIRDGGNGRFVLIDQPPTASERPYIARDKDVQMSDVPSTPTDGHPHITTSTNGDTLMVTDPALLEPIAQLRGAAEAEEFEEARRASESALYVMNGSDSTTRADSVPTPSRTNSMSSSAQGLNITSPTLAAAAARALQQAANSPTDRRAYNVAPPPLGAVKSSENGSGDRLEDLISQLARPKPPKENRRLTWRCDCNLELSVDIDDADKKAIANLQDISIVCSKSSKPYMKVQKSTKFHVIGCDELATYVARNTNQSIETRVVNEQTAVTQ